MIYQLSCFSVRHSDNDTGRRAWYDADFGHV